MNTLEEEEDIVVPENSLLFKHFEDLGVSERCTLPPGDKGNDLPSVSATKNKICLEKHLFEEISILRETRLIFEDDLVYVGCLMSNYSRSDGEMLRWMFRGTTSALVVALGLCFFVFIGSYAFVLVSAFYAYRTSDFLWRKHRRLRRLRRLMRVLNSNFDVTNRAIKYLFEQEKIFKSKLNGNLSGSYGNFLLDFKREVVFLQKKINKVLLEAISNLTHDVPLSVPLDHPLPHMSDLEKNSDISISQLYNCYMLLQSHLLVRLILCTIPSLLVKPESSDLKTAKIVHKLTVCMEAVQDCMSSKLNTALINGCCIENSCKPTLSFPEKRRKTKFSCDELTRNVHDLSNSLQFSLLKSRELEASLENRTLENPEKELHDILQELSNCQTHIEQLIILQNRKPTSAVANPSENRTEEIKYDLPAFEIGLSNLDPEVDDDIFETVITCDSDQDVQANEWDTDELDPLLRKKHKEVLGELKYRLKEQADDWAKREQKVCERKGIAVLDRINKPDIVVDSAHCGDDKVVGRSLPKTKTVIAESFGDSSSDDERDMDVLHGRSSLASALLKARSDMFTDQLQEDSFSGSGENSEEEE